MFNINSNPENLKAFNERLKLLKKIEKVQSGFESNSYIELTKFHNSSNWQHTLEKVGALQVLENKKKVGIILEPETFDALVEYLNLIDKEMELTSFAAMVERSKGTTGYLSGEKLTKEALEIFDEHKEDIRKFLDNED